MKKEMIAPCGMNCSLCIAYLGKKNDINSKGFNRKYCDGCRARGKNCLHMADACEKLGKGLIDFCYSCDDFPCKRLKTLDKRYRTKYHLSMIDNLNYIKKNGMDSFLKKEAKKWVCENCNDVICCHNGLCLSCDLEKLKNNKKYCWDESSFVE